MLGRRHSLVVKENGTGILNVLYKTKIIIVLEEYKSDLLRSFVFISINYNDAGWSWRTEVQKPTFWKRWPQNAGKDADDSPD